MGIIMRISMCIAILVVFTTPTRCAGLHCIFSEIARNDDIIFRFKTTETLSTFSFIVKEEEHKNTLVLADSTKGTIKLARSLIDILTWRTDNTSRITGDLTQTKNGAILNRVTIEFIILREGYADNLLSSVIGSVPTLAKASNPFRPTTLNYPFYKKLHSIMMRGTKRSTATSLAGCKFAGAYQQLVKLILKNLAENQQINLLLAKIHVGPQGILTPEKLEELIEATGCIPEIENPDCPPETIRFRTIDGTCNNRRIGSRTNGAAETGFQRFLPPSYFGPDGLDGPPRDQPNAPDLPSPSIVTNDYIVIQSKNQLNPDQITHMFMQWGQFLDHDLTLAPESENGDVCEDVPCNGSPEDDIDPCYPVLPAGGRPCIRLIRSAARCPINGFKLLPREQINVNTAYIDGSMIYGSSESVANAVRDLSNDFGLLRTSSGNLLPIDNSQLGEPNSLCENLGSCFLAGDNRVNEQAGLAAMHTLWVREHNKIATGLRNLNRHWDGERIYQEARKIVGALVQQITYEEWLPIAIGRDALRPYRGYNRNVNSGISNAFATAAFRLGHSLIRPKFEFLSRNFRPFPFSPIPLNRLFFNNTQTQLNGIDGWIIGMLGNFSQVMDNEMAIGLTDQLFERPNIDRVGLNLAALNMQRGREHGLPFYSAFLAECQRRFPGIYPIDVSDVTSFDQIRALFPPQVFESIKSVYNNKPQNTDLFPAGIGEIPISREFGRPKRKFKDDRFLPKAILGPTFTCLLIDQFERARDGDRFFYLRRNQFTAEQLHSIYRRGLSDVICNNVNVVSVPRLAFLRFAFNACPTTGRPMDLGPWREPVRSCDQRPCRNNGVCREFRSVFRRRVIIRCRCPRGFNGRFCENRLQ